MVKIRLQKIGRKNAPAYRIVVANVSAPRNGKYIQLIGFYNPSHNPPKFEIKKDLYKEWLSKGAQPTEAVQELIDGKYKFVKYDAEELKKKKEAKIQAEEDAKAKAEEAAQKAEAKKEEKVEETKTDEEKADDKPKDKTKISNKEGKKE